MPDSERRRRRVRVPRADPEPTTETAPVHDPPPVPLPGPPPTPPTMLAAPAEDRETERGLRGLVGAGSSQVSVSAAMRARDAARPRPEDLDRAEGELTIVRRNWTPDSSPPTSRRPSSA